MSNTQNHATIFGQATRWLIYSPGFAAFRRELDVLDRLGMTAGTEHRSWMMALIDRYAADENLFYKNSSVAMAVASVSTPTFHRIIELAETEHSTVSTALQQPATRETTLRNFYNGHHRQVLYLGLLPHAEAAGGYCNGQLQALSLVKSFSAWRDRAFYEASVLNMLRIRAQLRVEPSRVTVLPTPVYVTVNPAPSRTVVRTIERDKDGAIAKIIDCPMEE